MGILEMIESDEKPFESKNSVGEQPKENSYNSNNGSYKERDKDEVTDWNNPNIEGKKMDVSKFTNETKSFTIAVANPQADLPEAMHKRMMAVAEMLVSKKMKYRTIGQSAQKISNDIIAEFPASLEIYLPWKSFNKDLNGKLNKPSHDGYVLAAYYHRGFKKLKDGMRAVLASTVHTILGEDLKSPINALIVYTDDGAETIKQIDFKTTLNASFAIYVAETAGIPVFNIKNDESIKRLDEYLKTL